jgi:hypothetical protein
VKRLGLSIILLLLSNFLLFGQEEKERLSLNAERIDSEIKIDGILDDEIWQNAKIVTDFIQKEPIAGTSASRKTEVQLVYDNSAIYVAATMYDERDSMSRTLSQRDDLGNADWFGVVFDPYNAGTIGFAFLVTSAGVQIDELHDVENIDANWNAVWKSAVQVSEDKWVAEFKIPFSALRFSKDSKNDWGVNFARNIRRNREQSFWNPFDPTGLNLISQLGVLKGVKDVDSPLRLALTPYVSGYIENYDGSSGYSANGGMDVKWGINEAFTLDMTLIPDFGQVQFDNQVLNTSPFEVRFNERRQFFTEGTELFNKTDEVFYSRRIGSTPVNFDKAYDELDTNEVVSFNPSSTQLLNATKISGRTRKGTGVGFFNAITGRMDADITDTITGLKRTVRTGPLSNYNVFVIDQNLNNNSSISLTNSNVWREGGAYDANVTAAVVDVYTKGQKYNYWGIGTLSQIIENGSADLGHQVYLGAEKSAGNFQGGAFYAETSSSFDPNDLGFNQRTNIRNVNLFGSYNIYKPFWRFYRFWSSASVSYQRLIDPNVFTTVIVEGNVGGSFRNFLAAGLDLFIEPVRANDYFEPRVDGRFYKGDALTFLGGFISSDYSKPFALDVRGGWFQYYEENRQGFDLNISPRIRFNDKWFLVYRYAQNNAFNEEGVALTNDFEVPLIGDDPVFAKRDRTTITNTIDLSYIFNNKMGITFRLRHYWSKLDYNEFFVLNDDGIMEASSYTGLDINDESIHNNSFNAFTIDMAYRWVFAPGSELSLVWKNSIFSFNDEVELNYFENVGRLVDDPATNSLSLKVLYYIDYWQFHQRVFKKM